MPRDSRTGRIVSTDSAKTQENIGFVCVFLWKTNEVVYAAAGVEIAEDRKKRVDRLRPKAVFTATPPGGMYFYFVSSRAC